MIKSYSNSNKDFNQNWTKNFVGTWSNLIQIPSSIRVTLEQIFNTVYICNFFLLHIGNKNQEKLNALLRFTNSQAFNFHRKLSLNLKFVFVLVTKESVNPHFLFKKLGSCFSGSAKNLKQLLLHLLLWFSFSNFISKSWRFLWIRRVTNIWF